MKNWKMKTASVIEMDGRPVTISYPSAFYDMRLYRTVKYPPVSRSEREGNTLLMAAAPLLEHVLADIIDWNASRQVLPDDLVTAAKRAFRTALEPRHDPPP